MRNIFALKQGDSFMIFNLMAEVGESVAEGGMSLLTIIGIAFGASVILAGVIFGAVLSARRTSNKAKRKQAKHEKRNKPVEAPAVVVVQEPVEDFTHLTEEEKNVLRKYRNLYK